MGEKKKKKVLSVQGVGREKAYDSLSNRAKLKLRKRGGKCARRKNLRGEGRRGGRGEDWEASLF